MANRRRSNSEKTKKNRIVSKTPGKNWLLWLDQMAIQWPAAQDWLQYGDFVLVRFPSLRPPADGNQNLRAGYDAFCERISIWKGRIKKSIPSVMENLSEQQQEQLAALLSDCNERFEFKGMRNRQRGFIVTEKRGRSRQKVLGSKFNAVLRALRDLQCYASGLEPVFDTVDLVRAVGHCLSLIKQAQPMTHPDEYFKHVRESIESFYPFRAYPSTFNIVTVFCFFHHECGQSEDEAEVRTGRIHNTLWKHWVSPITVHETPETGESRGCPLVHVTIRKFKPLQRE